MGAASLWPIQAVNSRPIQWKSRLAVDKPPSSAVRSSTSLGAPGLRAATLRCGAGVNMCWLAAYSRANAWQGSGPAAPRSASRLNELTVPAQTSCTRRSEADAHEP